jgi:hypothetical protein
MVLHGRRHGLGLALLLMGILPACAQVQPIPSAPAHAASVAVVTPAAPVSTPAPAASVAVAVVPVVTMDPALLSQDELLLQAEHAKLVTRALPIGPTTEAQWQQWAQAAWAASGKQLDRDQAVVVVNRNTHVQQIAVMIAHPNGAWTLIGVSPTSTGQAGRDKHFISPLGVFDHDGSIMDYRALGTKNENGIRGIGAKGSRVWDFGWQSAQTGWLKTPEMRDIRFELHATDPDLLDQRLGHPASAGCIRISAGLNKFLDHYGILDQVYWSQAPDSVALRALLPKDGEPTLSGRYMIVLDQPKDAEVATTPASPPPVAAAAVKGLASQ